MNLTEDIKTIQRIAGVPADGIFGPVTARGVLRELARVGLVNGEMIPDEEMDARSAKNLLTLDEKARGMFEQFHRLANATAASLRCSYVLIGGNRTWEEQDALYARGRTEPGTRVTNAKGGQSNHNFGIAGDYGVFRGKVYLDSSDPALAAKVHRACSLHAASCGLVWGGSWKGIVDMPHYEVATDLTMMQKRNLYKEKGSVL